MILTAKLMGYDDQSPEMKTFEIVIQLGAILAMAWVYRERILNLLGLSKKITVVDLNAPKGRLNLIHILLGIVPALAVGFFFRDFIKGLFSSQTVLWALVVGGIFMIFAEWFNKNKAVVTAQEMDQLTYK
ncbi:undecaprenyl-diphosphate phosphatase, partial [Enterococcus faecium]|uniref:undecaprenyl-diphosphate phosphatase n=2 Tax=Bacilli TaxID=91061 RepID=UPI002905BBC1